MLIGEPGTHNSGSTQPHDPATTITDGNITYTAHGGETLGEVSARYGVTPQQILAANPQLRSLAVLKKGQEVTVPVMDNGNNLPTQIQVTTNQSLTSIAGAAHVSVSQLAEANGLSSTAWLNNGMSLWVPVQANGTVGISPGKNPFQPQMDAVDAAVKQYDTAQTPAQRQAAAAAITQAVEQELSARAAVEEPQGELPDDTLLSDYATAVGSRYGNDPGINQAIQQGVSNEEAVVTTDYAVRQGDASQVYSAVVQEIQTRAGGQALTPAMIKQYAAQIQQRYAHDPAAAKSVSTALQTAPANILAQQIVTQVSASGNTSQQLAALDKAYLSATPPVQKALLSQPGAQAILKAAATQDLQPLMQAQKDKYIEAGLLEQGLQNLDNTARGLDPNVAAALVNQAMPSLTQFNTLYAKDHGGSGIGADDITAGPDTVATVMDLSGLIAGTSQGDADISQFAKIGFWSNGAVTNALADGASTAYPLAVAQMDKADGGDPTNVMEVMKEGVEQDQQRVQSDVKALGANNAQLTWLINNVGPSMTQAQLQAAISSYGNQGDWSKKNQQLIQQTIKDANNLMQNMSSLSELAQSEPSVAKTLGVNDTLSGVLNDPVTSYGLSLAAGTNTTVFQSNQNGQAFLSLVSSLKLADQGRKTAQLLGSLYVRGLVTSALKNGVDWDGSSDPLSEAQAVINTLKTPGLSNWMGVNDNTVWKSAVNIVSDNLVKPGDTPEEVQSKLQTIDQKLNKLKALSSSTPAGQMLRSIAVAYALANTLNSAQKFSSADNLDDRILTGLDTFAAAAGLLQKGANLANGFGWVSKKSIIGKFAQDTWNGGISAFAGALDIVEGVGSLEGWLGQKQDTATGVFDITGGVGSLLYGASQFSETSGMDWLAGVLGVDSGAGALSASLGLVGVGIVAATVVGQGIYQAIKGDHANQAATVQFLQAGGYSSTAANALSEQDGVLSGAGGASGLPFLAEYAAMKHLSTAQLQQWVNGLSASQVHTLDQCLLQTAGDCHGNVANFTDGPAQRAVIPDYSGGGAAIVPVANTVSVFESNLTSSGVPLPK